jgi:hypothetical protein
MRRLIIGVILVTLGVLAMPGAAQAETCVEGSDWLRHPEDHWATCLLADTSQPLAPGGTVGFRVPANTVRFAVTSCPADGMWAVLGHCENAALPTSLVAAGPPDGTSLWQSTLAPWFTNVDGPLAIETERFYLSSCGQSETCDSIERATFSATGLAPIVSQVVRVERSKAQVSAVYRIETRMELVAEIRLTLNSFKGGVQILKHREQATPLGAGVHELRIAIPRTAIRRKCGTKTAPHCSVLASARLMAGDLELDRSNDRKRVR